MKTSPLLLFTLLLPAIPGFAAEPPAAVAEPASPSAATAEAAAASSTPVAFATWDDIKNLTHEQRADFAAGLKRLEGKFDTQIEELNAKKAKMKTENKEWDFAMRSLNDARAYLKSLSAEVADTSSEVWLNEKEKVFRALQSVKDAYDRVKTTTTQA